MNIRLQILLSSTVILAAMLWPASLQAEDTPLRTKLMASFCVSCHGQGAKGALKVPPLNELKVSDIRESMIGFKSGEERSTVMEGIAKDLSKQDIALLAEYFAALPE